MSSYAGFMGIENSRFNNRGFIVSRSESLRDDGTKRDILLGEAEVFFAYQSAGDLRPRGLSTMENQDSATSLLEKTKKTSIVLHYQKSIMDILESNNKVSFKVGNKEFEISSYEDYQFNKIYIVLQLEKVSFGQG